jgi:hypothetical protein
MGDRKSDSTINVEGDTVTGTVKAGAFGAFPMSGSRKARSARIPEMQKAPEATPAPLSFARAKVNQNFLAVLLGRYRSDKDSVLSICCFNRASANIKIASTGCASDFFSLMIT